MRKSELGGLAGDSGYTAVIQGSIVGTDLIQIGLITHTLGLTEFGRFSLMVAFVAIIIALMNPRVGIAATTFGARHLRGEPRCAAGVFQLSYLVDLATGTLCLVFIALLITLLGSGVVGGVGFGLVALYALAPLSKVLDTTPLVILRLRDRFRLIAGVTLATEVLRLVLVIVALTVSQSLLAVVVGLVAGKLIASTIKAALAFRIFSSAFDGVSLTRPAIKHLPRDERRAMLRTIFQSSFISFDSIGQVQAPTLLLGAFAGATEVGIYKIGMTVAAVVGQAVDPVSMALLPRLSRLWAAGRLRDLQRLVRQATLISLPVIAVLYLAVVVLRDPVLELIGGGPAARAAGTVLILGAAGQAMYAAVFWRGAVLHAAHRTGAVAAMSVAGAFVAVPAALLLIPPLGAEGAAIAVLLSRVLVNASLAVLAVRVLNRAAAALPK